MDRTHLTGAETRFRQLTAAGRGAQLDEPRVRHTFTCLRQLPSSSLSVTSPLPLPVQRPPLTPSSLSDSAVTSDDLLAWLRPFCGDASLPVRPRIDVLQILESNFSLRDSDVRLLLLYRTRAVLKDREVARTHTHPHPPPAVTHHSVSADTSQTTLISSAF